MSELTYEERHEILNNKEKCLQLPIAFFHPVNSAPGEQEYEQSVKQYKKLMRAYRRDQSLSFWDGYPLSDLTLASLDGTHTWRNIHFGHELITLSVGPGQWNGWILLPDWDEWQENFESPVDFFDDRYCVTDWVLCDNITDEQRQSWETFRKTVDAVQKIRRNHKVREVQIEMF